MLRDGDEAPPSKDSAQHRDYPTAQQPPPSQWAPSPPRTQSPPWGYRQGYSGYAEPYDQAYVRAPQGAYPPPEDAYRFRPLGERERRRIEEQARSPYGSSYPYPSAGDYSPSQRQPGTSSPPAYGVDPATREPWMRDWGGRSWGTEGYGFGQPEPGRLGPDRWQGPYSSPVGPGDWPPSDPGIFQEPNQWGAIPPERTPPSYRMYPSLDAHRDRRLTAR